MIPTPEWVDREAWDEYVAQRRADKKALTLRSAKQRLARLYELKAAGHDPNACIDEAINGHWLDFYAPKDKQIQRAATAGTGELQRYEAEPRRGPTPEEAERLRALQQRLRRVG